MRESGTLADVRVVASGLAYPEGPVALADGSVLVAELRRGTVSRVSPEGAVEVVADCGGAPNGIAVGPDGAAYVCNNGGAWPDGYTGGRVERVDLDTGRVDVLYEACDGTPLRGPNDLVFDRSGGFWFTDMGKTRGDVRDLGAIYYAAADGSELVKVFDALDAPNGIGLSADERTLYFAETFCGRLYRRAVTGRASVEHARDHDPDTLVHGAGGLDMFDSLAVDGEGNVCVGTLISGCVTVVSPDGARVTRLRLPPGFEDPRPTNICFGGPGGTTAYVTLALTGRLVACPWPAGGQPLAFGR